MPYRRFILPALAVAFLGASGPVSAAGADPRPDIVLIMADDMGFSDVGCYGGEIHTPTIDSLAMDGVRFTQFHNTARCCPTRASILTGLYPHQAGLAVNGRSLNRNGATLAELLGANGYRTCMVGKWHLSEDTAYPDQLAWLSHRATHPTFADTFTYPCKRGFDEHFGTIWGVVDHFDPFSLVHNTEPVPTVPAGYYQADALNDKAVEYLDKLGKDDKPFFLYLAHNAPHWPLHAKPEDIARYEKTFIDGWDSLRVRRYHRQIEMGLISKDQYPLPPFENNTQWSTADKAWAAHNMAVHAAMIDRMDQGLARVIAKLKELGRYDNTLIFFLSDNGASPEQPGGPGYDRPNTTRNGTPITYNGRPNTGVETVWGGIGPMWANASNTPFRYWKKESYEGGTNTPLVVHWPKGLKLSPGSITQQLGHVIDIVPTCLQAAGATYPASYHGNILKPLEGQSLLPVLQGGPPLPERTLYWEHEGGRAMRIGPWKLVSLSGQPWELYDLDVDRTESNNLAAAEPARVNDMKAKWDAWYARVMADAAIKPSLKVAYPNGGESFPVGSVQTLRWTTANALGIHHVKIEYDAGTGWKTIAATAPHVGEFAWTVPNDLAAKARLRVTSLETANADTSDGTFAITAGTGLRNGSGTRSGYALRLGGRQLTFPHWIGAAPEKLEFTDAKGRVVRVINVAEAGGMRMERGIYEVRPMGGGVRGAAIKVAWY